MLKGVMFVKNAGVLQGRDIIYKNKNIFDKIKYLWGSLLSLRGGTTKQSRRHARTPPVSDEIASPPAGGSQ